MEREKESDEEIHKFISMSFPCHFDWDKFIFFPIPPLSFLSDAMATPRFIFNYVYSKKDPVHPIVAALFFTGAIILTVTGIVVGLGVLHLLGVPGETVTWKNECARLCHGYGQLYKAENGSYIYYCTIPHDKSVTARYLDEDREWIAEIRKITPMGLAKFVAAIGCASIVGLILVFPFAFEGYAAMWARKSSYEVVDGTVLLDGKSFLLIGMGTETLNSFILFIAKQITCFCIWAGVVVFILLNEPSSLHAVTLELASLIVGLEFLETAKDWSNIEFRFYKKNEAENTEDLTNNPLSVD